MLDSTIPTYVCSNGEYGDDEDTVTARDIIKALKRTTGFATFRVDAAEEMVGKCIPHWCLDDGLWSDGEIGPDQPYWHTQVEELITHSGVRGKTTHPIQVDGGKNERGVADMRKDIEDIVQEYNDVRKIALGLSHKYNDITEGERVVEKDHKIMVDHLEKASDKVLLVPTCFFPVLILYGGDPAQRGHSQHFLLLQLAHKEGRQCGGGAQNH